MATQQVFVALQCCQCSTMQVKLQKRCSNKWICAVCNQRQSVRKIFARGCLARDVRGFVQQFNMSRMTEDGLGGQVPKRMGAEIRTSPPSLPSSGAVGCARPRRNDWSVYLDPEEVKATASASEEAISTFGEPEVVTETPAAISGQSFPKRPLLKPRESERKEALKPMVTKRKLTPSPQPQPFSHHNAHPLLDDWPPRSPPPEFPQFPCRDYLPAKHGGVTKRPREPAAASSKWSEYLEEDPGERPGAVGSPDPSLSCGGDVKFVEEVHPDFL